MGGADHQWGLGIGMKRKTALLPDNSGQETPEGASFHSLALDKAQCH